MTVTTWLGGSVGLTLLEGHASNIATFTLIPADGVDYPFSFPDGSTCTIPGSTGITLALPSIATIGTTNAVAFRLWFAVFNNNGTPALAVRRCAAGVVAASVSVQNPLEHLAANTTAMTTGSTSAHVFYSTAALTSKYWAWAAFATYESGLTTAGAWAASPTSLTTVTQFTPRPGTVIQTRASEGSVASNQSTITTSATSLLVNITMQSAAHFIECGIGTGYIYIRTGGVNGQGAILIVRTGAGTVTVSTATAYTATANDILMPCTIHAFDIPNSTAALTYTQNIQNITSGFIGFVGADIYAQEIMT